jgi:hypothetical protein
MPRIFYGVNWFNVGNFRERDMNNNSQRKISKTLPHTIAENKNMAVGNYDIVLVVAFLGTIR